MVLKAEKWMYDILKEKIKEKPNAVCWQLTGTIWANLADGEFIFTTTMY